MKYLLLFCILMFSRVSGQVAFQKDAKTGKVTYHKAVHWSNKTPAIGVMSSFERVLQENISLPVGIIDSWEVTDENLATLQTRFFVAIKHDTVWYKCSWRIELTANIPVVVAMIAQDLQFKPSQNQPWAYCTEPAPTNPDKNLAGFQLIFLNQLEFFASTLLRAAKENDTFGNDTDNPPSRNSDADLKPVIYLYPQQKQDVTVTLNYDGNIFVSYPPYNPKTGWQVQATPSGEIYCNDKIYNYLFWEGNPRQPLFMPAEGTVIPKKDALSFLEYTTTSLGLSDKEKNEFIVFWLPKLLKNEFTHIYFAGSDYTARAQLTVSPQPETVIRVFMMIQGVSGYKTLRSQVFSAPKRKGFVVVEWGGAELPAEEQ